ncbi:hypothetical protein [Oricola sp.]|uniref:hypothetical protein n=1 Tax=Oricola sp. TaxID=1979950 RepID=UPI003BAA46FF
MTDAYAPLRQFAPDLPGVGFLRRLYRDEPAMMATAVVMALIVIPFSAAALIDMRTHLGINIWIKPIKFAVALSVYTATLAFFARWLRPEFRASRAYRWFTTAVITAIAAEMAWIAGAAALGTSSHFNTATPALGVLYGLMGGLATLLTSATAVYAWGIARNRETDLPRPVKEALVTGLALNLPLTLITAGTLASMTGHAVGGTGSDADGLWLMGWLRDAGDLRVPHFFATHAMHALPLAGLVALTLSDRRRLLAVRLAAAAYTVFVIYTLVQALSGQPFLPMLG